MICHTPPLTLLINPIWISSIRTLYDLMLTEKSFIYQLLHSEEYHQSVNKFISSPPTNLFLSLSVSLIGLPPPFFGLRTSDHFPRHQPLLIPEWKPPPQLMSSPVITLDIPRRAPPLIRSYPQEVDLILVAKPFPPATGLLRVWHSRQLLKNVGSSVLVGWVDENCILATKGITQAVVKASKQRVAQVAFDTFKSATTLFQSSHRQKLGQQERPTMCKLSATSFHLRLLVGFGIFF